ncbi:MAG: AAA family ATPase, partial [Pseudomonadota bacterium]
GADAEASAVAPVFEEELGDNVIAEAEIGFADGAEVDHQPVPGEAGEEVWAGAEAPYEGEASDALAEPYSQTDFTDETAAFDASPSALDPVEASEDTYHQEDWADDSVSLEAPTEPLPAQESFEAEPPRILRRSKKSAPEETQSQDFFSDILEADELGSMDEDEAERLLEEEARFDDPDLNPLTEREASAEEHDAPDAAELHPQGPVAGDAPAGLTRFQGAGQPHSTAAAIDVEISEQPFYNPEQAHYELPDEALASQITTDRPVPRISIQAFCDDPKNGVIIQKAAEDRRLAKAHVTVHMGGMKGAIEYFRDTPTPNLIFIEMPLDAGDVFARLEELAQVCDPGTKVVLIGRINDVMLYRALMRNGVSEYLVPPLSVPQVIDTISALYIDPEAPPIGRCISFMGSKGGTGSSVLAHNIAWIIAEDLFEDVTLVDFDLHFGTTGLDFNQEPQQGVADALTTPERLDDQLLERLLLRCSDRLSLFAAPGSLERTFDIDAESYEAVIDVVRASVPVVIVDLPSSWEMWSRRILSFSEEIVITATPDLASLRNTKNMVDLLKAARPNDADPKLVINQVGIPKRPEIPVKDFGEAVGLEPALVLPFDPQLFGAAANNGQMLSQLKPDARASAGLKHLAQSLSSRDAQESEKSNVVDMFKSLLKRK